MLNTVEFIKKSNQLHAYKYNYSKSKYIGWSIKLIITCLTHGDFLQSPNSHLQGRGCPKCKIDYLKGLRKLTTEEFIKKAKLTHGDKYDYSKVQYNNSQTKVTIICPIHGEFEQIPNDHLGGHGCNSCCSSKGELCILKILDKQQINYQQEYRIPNQSYILYYDFYLPDYNVLIEFHGEQHFKYKQFFHRNGKNDLLKQQERDLFKKILAKELGYRFLEFNYKQLKQLSEEQFEQLILKKLMMLK